MYYIDIVDVMTLKFSFSPKIKSMLNIVVLYIFLYPYSSFMLVYKSPRYHPLYLFEILVGI